jgi:hypothetical protein
VLDPSAFTRYERSPAYDASSEYGYLVGWPGIPGGGCLRVYVDVYSPVLQGHPEPIALTLQADSSGLPQYGSEYQAYLTPHLTAPTFRTVPLFTETTSVNDLQTAGSLLWNWYLIGDQLGSQPIGLSVDVELRSEGQTQRTLLLFRTDQINVSVGDPRTQIQRIWSGTSQIWIQSVIAIAVGAIGVAYALFRRRLFGSDGGE